MTIRIAVVQQETIPGAWQANRSKALDLAEESLEEDADVVLFHEGLLVGYHERYRELAEAADGETTKAFQNLLDGRDAKVIYGLTEGDGDRFYLSAVVVDRTGLVACYRKTHLWWKAEGLRHEPSFYSPGERLVTFDVGGHKSGLMICYDGDFPEMTRSYALVGCRMVFWMNNRGSRGHAEVERLASANSMIMATSCCCGKDESASVCRGGSNITDMDGSALAEIWDQEGIIYADVNPDLVDEARRANPWFTGRRGDLYI